MADDRTDLCFAAHLQLLFFIMSALKFPRFVLRVLFQRIFENNLCIINLQSNERTQKSNIITKQVKSQVSTKLLPETKNEQN